MKYTTLLALAKAIRINDQETCLSTTVDSLAQVNEQLNAQVDEQLAFGGGGETALYSQVLSVDLLQIANAIGVVNGTFTYGSNSTLDNDNIYTLLTKIRAQNEDIILKMDNYDGKIDALEGKVDIIDGKLVALDEKLDDMLDALVILGHDTEWSVIR
jgi:hypothetical protein